MSNINFFFPKRMQGLALGLNAGLGNFGVTTMQILVPLAMTFGLFGALGGDSMVLQNTSGTLIGKIPAGSDTWIQNAGFIWLLFLVPLAFAGLVRHEQYPHTGCVTGYSQPSRQFRHHDRHVADRLDYRIGGPVVDVAGERQWLRFEYLQGNRDGAGYRLHGVLA